MGKSIKRNILGWLLTCLTICVMFAAGGTIVNAAPEAGAVYVQNGNGAYLQKIDNAWYLFDAEDQRVTGLQYISINPDQIIDETERGGAKWWLLHVCFRWKNGSVIGFVLFFHGTDSSWSNF